MNTVTPLSATEILARLEAAGVQAKIWTGGNVMRVYIQSTPEWGSRPQLGYVTPDVAWRASLSTVALKIKSEIQRILFP